jgi:hypothetical protein
MQRSTNFEVGDIVAFKKDYYLLLQYISSGETFDVFKSVLLRNGKIDCWVFSNKTHEKVAYDHSSQCKRD